MYNTKQKNMIIQLFKSNPNKEFHVKKLLEILNISKATLYRNLQLLINENIIIKFYDENNSSYLYQYVENVCSCHDHIHLKCEECGKIMHLCCNNTKSLINHIESNHNFVVNLKSSLIYGKCVKCMRGI